uniref:Uncharacterized protein n=1 Tax=Trypanosoma vivax (strain Y486) TaxID=1055687 RepID=G0TTD6_TRYVY|nr:hypothetical protein TVY486_0303930 [Trypanosoma vivax Y486]
MPWTLRKVTCIKTHTHRARSRWLIVLASTTRVHRPTLSFRYSFLSLLFSAISEAAVDWGWVLTSRDGRNKGVEEGSFCIIGWIVCLPSIPPSRLGKYPPKCGKLTVQGAYIIAEVSQL